MKLKKIFLLLILAYIFYLGIGTILLNYEVIHKLHILPGWTKVDDEDKMDDSTVDLDGPLILYEDGKLIKYQVLPEGNAFSFERVEINRNDILVCFVSETKDSFKFQLKDTLKTESSEHLLQGKMMIISDIEGNFKGFKSILEGNGIIDNNFNWTFGNNQLVLVGDFFDRGLNVTECLWLIYKLEVEAERQGGKVHFLLGNHEVMNLKGQFKYVRNKYKQDADSLKLEYKNWYSGNSELGRWLRTKNTIEKIGGYLFVHAGISKDFPKNYTLEEINTNVRESIDNEFEKGKQGLDTFIGRESPIWYRGIAKGIERQEDIDSTLLNYQADKMIIGHTIFDEMQYLYNESVIVIDLEHKINSDIGRMFALWYEDGDFSMTDNNGAKSKLKRAK